MKLLRLLRLVGTLTLLARGGALAQGPAADIPWWDNYPLIVKGGVWSDDAPGIGVRFHADVVFCSSADDPGWGVYGQRAQMVEYDPKGEAKVRAAHLRSMGYFETFGTGYTCIVQLQKNSDGSWVKYPGYPDVTRVFTRDYNWQMYNHKGEIRWIGPHNYFDDEDFARPYTRTHPRYGSPPMTYPDGRLASGYNGPPTDPRNSRVYDAGCSKDVLGNVAFEYGYNDVINDTVHRKGGPYDGLIKVGDRYSGLIFPSKDSACPLWIDYARATTLQALDAGLDSMWTDNFSPWDSFNYRPITKAFGDWSVTGFREYLAGHFSSDDFRAMGVADPRTFDVRAYLRNKLSAFGGTATDLTDWRWEDPRWLDDPVWRAYKIYKRQTGSAALAKWYETVKSVAAAAGKPDFLVAGNDFSGFNLGWARGNLDMVSTELSWGPGLEVGQRGLMPPPIGSYVPTYKQAREQARSRFVNVWMYLPAGQLKKPGIANVLFYQGLANHTFPLPQILGNVTAGDDAANAAFFAFVRSVRPTLGARLPVEEIAIYHSPSSQLAFLTPNGAPISTIDAQPHSFSYLGWGTALGELQYQYRSVPEWKLTPAMRSGLRVLIIPDAEVFDPDDVAILEPWIRAGGALIVTGDSGLRRGEAHNFDRNAGGLSLAPLTGAADFSTAPAQQLRRMGNGAVLYLKDNIGMHFYNAAATRPGLLAPFANAINAVTAGQAPFVLSNVGGVPTTVGLTVYDDSAAQRRFVDVNNVDINLNTDTITPSPAITFTLKLPAWLQGKPLTARVLSPDSPPAVTITPNGTDRVDVTLSSVRLYASVVIE